MILSWAICVHVAILTTDYGDVIVAVTFQKL